MIQSACGQQDYRKLTLDSSNDLLEHDSRRVLGRFAEAACHALQAAEDRKNMGQFCYEPGRHTDAAEAWLSAANCFLLATARERATEIVKSVHKLEAEGKLPVERNDLYAALAECDERLDRLSQREDQCFRDLGREGYESEEADERSLRFLQQQLKELPGFAKLHYAIFRQALGLEQRDLAERHLDLAVTFDRDNANLVALLGDMYITDGKPASAVTLAERFLVSHPSNSAQVRVMLAYALGVDISGRAPDQERALEVLRPLVDGTEDSKPQQRIAALALSATFARELGQERQFNGLIEEMHRVEDSIAAQDLRGAIADLRAIFRRSIPNGADASNRDRRFLLPDRLEIFLKARQLIEPAPLAA